MAITKHVTDTVEKIKTSDGVQREINSTYLNGNESAYFVNTSEAQDVAGIKTFTNGLKTSKIEGVEGNGSVSMNLGGISFEGTTISFSSGGTTIFYGNAVCINTPTVDSHVANKGYVDSMLTSAVSQATTYVTNFNPAGPYTFVKVLEERRVYNVPLHPDANYPIVESSCTAEVVIKSILWKNSITGTYRITVSVNSVSMTSCTLRPRAIKIALINYASSWRFPTIYLSQIWSETATQLQRWSTSSWFATSLVGGCLVDQTTNIGILNGNGVAYPLFVGKASNNIHIAAVLAEIDTDHVNDNLPVYGFSYNFEILTKNTTL